MSDHVLIQIWGRYSQKCSSCKLLFKKSLGVLSKRPLGDSKWIPGYQMT